MSDLARQLIEKEKKERTGYLDLGNCGLTDLEKEVPELFELVWLEELLLGRLYSLYDDKEQKFKTLNSKNRGEPNRLTIIPENIVKFNGIKRLIITYNELDHPTLFGSYYFGKLKNIEYLNISGCYVESIDFITGLDKIQQLFIGQTNIVELNPLSKLKNLISLDIGENKIHTCSALKGLKSLQWLNAENNYIEDISSLSDLMELRVLVLSNNKIRNISALKNLINLRHVFLDSNEIENIAPVANLSMIETLDIQFNKVKDIKPLLKLIEIGMPVYYEMDETDGINLCENPFDIPPIETIEAGNTAILNYFRQLEEEGKEDYLFETKLLIIGEAGAGKTTFAKRIKKKEAAMPGEGESTHGIHVDRWEFDVPEGTFKEINHRGASFHVNLWGFGGQEVYHGTHQFFFSKKSLYVLLCDTREQKTDFRYWLNTVLHAYCFPYLMANKNWRLVVF